jgi:single-stranded DNA-binding protein
MKEITSSQDGKLISFLLPVLNRYWSKEKEGWVKDYILYDVRCVGDSARLVSEYGRKGRRVYVRSSSIAPDSYTSPEGAVVHKIIVYGPIVVFIDKEEPNGPDALYIEPSTELR